MIEHTDRVRYTRAHAKTCAMPKEALLVRGTVVDIEERSSDREADIHVLWDDGTRNVVREDSLRGA